MKETTQQVAITTTKMCEQAAYESHDGRIFSRAERCVGYEQALALFAENSITYRFLSYDTRRGDIGIMIHLDSLEQQPIVWLALSLLCPHADTRRYEFSRMLTLGWNVLYSHGNEYTADDFDIDNVDSFLEDLIAFGSRLNDEGLLNTASRTQFSAMVKQLSAWGASL